MFCQNCGNQLNESANFCPKCGKKVESLKTEKKENINKKWNFNNIKLEDIESTIKEKVKNNLPEQIKTKKYKVKNLNLENLIFETSDWLEDFEYEIQRLKTDDGGILLQISKKGNWRQLVGMKTALNIVFYDEGSELKVMIGTGKWLDKVITGGVSMLGLWPLALTTIVGSFEQVNLPNKIFNFIEETIKEQR